MNAVRSRLRSIGASLLLVSAMACTDAAPGDQGSHIPTASGVTVTAVGAPDDKYGSVVWGDRSLLIVGLDSSGNGPGGIGKIELGAASTIEPIRLPPRNDCSQTSYGPIDLLQDGTLTLVQSCLQSAFETSSPSTTRILELGSGSDARLHPLTPTIPAALGKISSTPDPARFVASVGVRTCNTIVVVDADGLHPFTTSESDLVPPPTSDGHSDCTADGRAASPSSSPQGDIAFFASPESAGVSGTARLDVPWNLYVADSSGSVRTILGGIQDARGLAWSPDGNWLAFFGLIDGVTGTWLVPRTGTTPTWISDDALELAWSPDATRLVEIQLVDINSLTSRLILVDVSGVKEAASPSSTPP